MSTARSSRVLAVDRLSVAVPQLTGGTQTVVDDVSFDLGSHATLALVGESGSGKSMTARAIMGILPAAAHVSSGSVRYDGIDLMQASESALRTIRGQRIAMIFQEALSALNPVISVGTQITELHRVHRGMSRREASREAVRLMELVQIPRAAEGLRRYPHEFSGGMRQRVSIAMALALDPEILIADEPTTALDVTVQAQVLELLGAIQDERGLSVILITHDLGVASYMAERIAVMHEGRIVEHKASRALFEQPAHPYTVQLLSSATGRSLLRVTERRAATAPDAGRPRPGDTDTVLSVEGLSKEFVTRRGVTGGRDQLMAVDDVSFSVLAGETLGIVGESGCGKSTLARLILGLEQPTAGRVTVGGRDVHRIRGRAQRTLRKQVQVVFQDPYAALNPRITVAESLGEGWRGFPALRPADPIAAATDLLALVGLGSEFLWRLPHQLSGGQRQRVGIARALALEPRVLILDEPTSALDVSVQHQIVELLRRLQADLDVSLVFISHDLALVADLADRVAVLRHGRVIELGAADRVLSAPEDPYTKSFLDAVLVPGRSRRKS